MARSLHAGDKMAMKKMKASEYIENRRWGLPGGRPNKKYPPLDRELLDLVLEDLGDAARGNQASIEDQISFIVGLHRTLKELERDPPRPASVGRNLNRVVKSASTLRIQIAALDYLSLRELHQNGAFKHPSLTAPLAPDQRKWDEYMAICEGEGSRLLSLLDAIVAASERALKVLPPDTGSSVKQPMLGGPANFELVAGCYRLFEEYRPGKAKTTEGGDFRSFVSHVYGLSTGEEADLERPIKNYFRYLKQNPKDD